MATLLENQE